VDLSFPASGCFVGYLVKNHGMDTVKKLYSEVKPNFPAAEFEKSLREATGLGLDQTESRWRALPGW